MTAGGRTLRDRRRTHGGRLDSLRDAGRRGGDLHHLQPGHRGPHRDPRDRAAHPRGAPAVDGRARPAPPGGGGGDRRRRGGVGQSQLVQRPARLRPRGGPLGLRGARVARARGGPRAPAAPAGAGQAHRLPQDGAGHLSLQRGRRHPLPEDGLHPGRGLPRAGPARRPLGRRADHGAPALSYGWTVVGTLCVTEIVSWGIMYYGFPVFLASMEADLDGSRVTITGAFTVGLAVAALAALPVGRWLDRRGPWGLMTLGSCLGVTLVIAWSRVTGVVGLYAVWTLMGLALAATLYEPAFGAVVRWFPTRHRDRALTIVTLAGALASTIFMPISAGLLQRWGWRPALLGLATILALVTIPLHALVLRRQPPHLARGRRRPAGPESRGPGVTLAVAARTPIFWALSLAFSIGSFATSAVTLHLIPYMVENGHAATGVAIAIGWMGAMQIPGRLVFISVAAGRFGAVGVTMAVFVAQALGLV